MAPRLHNTLSYSVSAIAFWAICPWDKPAAWLPAALWSVHFVRRALESLYVHRYSGRPVPATDAIIEYVYYWGFGAWIAWTLRAPDWSLPTLPYLSAGLFVFLCGEIGNSWAHHKLRALRSGYGQTTKTIPQGGAFNWVSCPHYLFEVITWCGFFTVVQAKSALLFWALGTAIVSSYAWVRHKAYLVAFDGREGRAAYPSTRRAIVPFFL